MIAGYFDEQGRPRIAGVIHLPSFGGTGEVDFLLDTGARYTCLAPGDGRSIGIDYRAITNWAGAALGVGGVARTTEVPALLRFTENTRIERYYRLQLDMLQDTPLSASLLSVIGRDILINWRTTYDPTQRELTAAVHSADHTTSP